jgi:Common central domain of tyrosinase
LVSIHAENAAASHSVIAFMIWQREFIHRFETALPQIDASVTLPYLNFSLDWRRPAASLIFGADMFGGANVGSIDFGVFANLNHEISVAALCASRSADWPRWFRRQYQAVQTACCYEERKKGRGASFQRVCRID